MDYNKVLKFQADLAKKYNYKSIPPMFREEVLSFYKDNLPEHFLLEGDNQPLFSSEGLKVCNKYNRIVIGDYGAFVEILPEDIISENIKVKEGQEYRDFNERYSARTKYSWLTSRDSSNMKIYFQKKSVDYADYVPGRYYISPYECSFSKVIEREGPVPVSADNIAQWLREQGVFNSKLLEYYVNLAKNYGSELRCVMDADLLPGHFEYWVKLNELCVVDGGLSFEQFQAVFYNLSVINCTGEELSGAFSGLSEEVRTAIQMGIDGMEIPYSLQKLNTSDIRSLLRMDAYTLLDVMHFTKVLVGEKAESIVKDGFTVEDINRLIGSAEQKIQVSEKDCEKSSSFVPELV